PSFRKVGLGSILARHKKQVVMAVASAILLAGGLQLSPLYSNNSDSSASDIAKVETPALAKIEQMAEPVVSQAMAEPSVTKDTIQTGSISPTPSANQGFSDQRIISHNAFVKPGEEVQAPETAQKFVPTPTEIPAEITTPALREAALRG